MNNESKSNVDKNIRGTLIMHEESESSVDEKITKKMSIIICRALFYTFRLSVVKTIKRPTILEFHWITERKVI